MWALSHSLRLKEDPSRCSSEMLSINLKPTFIGRPDPSGDAAKMFAVDSLEVLPLQDVKAGAPADASALFTQLEQQAQQAKDKGHHGLALAMVTVLGPGIMHFSPTIVNDGLTCLDYDPLWKERFATVIERGISY